MRAGHGAVSGAAGKGDFKFARQKLKLWVVGRPLSDQFGIGTWILKLIGGSTGKVIGGDVSNSVSRGLDCMHIHIS